VKLSKDIYRLKYLPVMIQILYGSIRLALFMFRCILKLFSRLIFLIYANLSVFNQRKIKPLMDLFYEYLYHRACDAFDCGIEQQNEQHISEEREIVIPIINRIGKFILQVVRLIMGIKKVMKRRKKKKILMSRKQHDQKKNGIISAYLARFQALFRVLEY